MEENELYSVLRAPSRGHEDAAFARLQDGRMVTYRAFFQGASRIASALAKLSVEPGDRVAAQIAKSVEALQLYVGTVMAGGVFLPLNTAYTPTELGHFINDASPTVFVCDPKAQAAISSLTEAGVVTLDAEGGGSLADAAGKEGRVYPGSVRHG